MDIIFNGPIKRYIRCGRAKSLYLYLQTWKLKLHFTAPGKPRPPFDPPKPDILDGLNYVSAAMESFKCEKFRAAVKRVFQAVGLAPDSNGKYKPYTSHASCKVVLKDFSEVEVINGSVSGLELLIPDVDVLNVDDVLDADGGILDADGGTESDDEEMEIYAASPVAADTAAADNAGTAAAVTERSATDATGTNIVSASTPDVVVTNTTDMLP